MSEMFFLFLGCRVWGFRALRFERSGLRVLGVGFSGCRGLGLRAFRGLSFGALGLRLGAGEVVISGFRAFGLKMSGCVGLGA